ncbi:FkbM family methyltransferase [Micromonospora sp. KC606]|uniref:FkbM family methyltransferase n=1 Tax=Micromonospora sp. KC606 TaxID=2530379 RepID=UPI00104CD25F|nr:FkbM family methyltransferase [Micromonospora sp. KC606]TDC85525.1 FkbM family methyltransferase [Micromonospora sp. KC606]
MDLSDTVVARFLEGFHTAWETVFFVQIGSNDGEHNDPLRPFILAGGWQGIMVEPVPYVFERLTSNYGDRAGLNLVNTAVTDHDGVSDFYCLGESADPLPEWYDQLGSFTLESMLDSWIQQVIPDIRDRIITITVPCATFESLCRRHGVGEIDLLHIDAEGHDYEIIRTIDLQRRKPTVLLYEHKHLSRRDRLACRQLLASEGYLTLDLSHDTLCLTRQAAASSRLGLGRAWQDAVSAMRVAGWGTR